MALQFEVAWVWDEGNFVVVVANVEIDLAFTKTLLYHFPVIQFLRYHMEGKTPIGM